jgi:hypothetical protein
VRIGALDPTLTVLSGMAALPEGSRRWPCAPTPATLQPWPTHFAGIDFVIGAKRIAPLSRIPGGIDVTDCPAPRSR